MDPALFCQVFFGFGTAVDIGGPLIPSFREYIMNYGTRSTPSASRTSARCHQNTFARLLEYVGSFQVPHTWFTHYYVISVASSVFWAVQIYTQGTAFEFLASFSKSRPATMTTNQVFLAWLLMAIQGARRLYESITFTKPSESKMWAGLWIIGMAFYVFMGISIWIEGTSVSLDLILCSVTDFSRFPEAQWTTKNPSGVVKTNGKDFDCSSNIPIRLWRPERMS
jgi:3-oxo-5-alpha-steroid 4-dehydrogenase 3 / polyprenol reductase